MYKKHIPLTFLERNPETGEFDLIVHDSLNKGGQLKSRAPIEFEDYPEDGGDVLILGAGVAGLTTAYDLLKQNLTRPRDKQFRVTVLEATGRVGGRSLTLRPGNPERPTPRDSFTEEFIDKDGKQQFITQTLTFEKEEGEPYEPYLNAGPGRIPSSHTRVLNLCKELGVDMEVYIMESRSNLVATRKPENEKEFNVEVNRHVANDIRGYIAEQLFEILGENGVTQAELTHTNYLELLKYFGALTEDKEGKISYQGSQRAGYAKLPGTSPGKLATPLDKDQLINSELWKRAFYQVEDWLWQVTSFQPVGGMDMIEKALEARINRLGMEWERRRTDGLKTINLNAKVTGIRKVGDAWVVNFEQGGNSTLLRAKYCLSNIPAPLLKDVVSPESFSKEYWEDLNKIITTPGFFEPTCKVGWQAERRLWQTAENTPRTPAANVPIYGGISRIDHPMTQMWYPSDSFHAKLGTLTGAYNYTEQAERWGKLLPSVRIKEAREGAAVLHGAEFARQLKHGISIAWQNIPTQRGGWTTWSVIADNVPEQARIMNAVRKGENNFHILGDQVSFVPGWKEGAIATALEVFCKVTRVLGYTLPEVDSVPDTKALTQGYQY